ncbi:hypothetical protein CMUS01_02068 [Colletotrichum musicola]|uniref:Uncharacterized protein n=1 Tax=Colletotrichum musicola TaxID=2175873 RepID=A0A8H6NVR4_9PEZI|nr:hypothetical protein CMUS01_02068 [Colletotrichum musicola]
MGVGPLRCVTCILDVAKNCYILLPRELELRRPCRPPTEMNADAPGVGLGRGASIESRGGRDDSSFSSWANATMQPILLHTAAASDELHERMDDLALREDSTSRRRRPAKRTDDQDTADTRPSPEINGRSSTWAEKTPQTVQSVPSATTLSVRQSPFRSPASKFSKPNLGLREVTVSISESTVAPFVRRS